MDNDQTSNLAKKNGSKRPIEVFNVGDCNTLTYVYSFRWLTNQRGSSGFMATFGQVFC